MLRFQVFRNSEAPAELDLSFAYLVGSDSVPIRGELAYVDGEIRCRKRPAGPAALSLMWEIHNFGAIMLETVRLPERGQPYVLNVELARNRMMRWLQKREDWGLLDIAEAQTVNQKFNEARDLLIEALENLENPPLAAKFADKCLAIAVPASEQTASVHAELLLHRRISTRSFPKNVFGCAAAPERADDPYRRKLVAAGEFIYLPMTWKFLEPQEQTFNATPMDNWVEYLRQSKLPMAAGPLVHFTESAIPDWLYIWEHDYETVRGLLYEHIERVVRRYGPHVALWNVLSGLHVNSHFSFTFDQLMDLTRMAITLVKKLMPNARTMIEITQPWGEYYAKNQRSIPPMIYAEMAVQSGIPFDIFGLQLCFGAPRDGGWQRDLFQISSALDRFAPMGKPVVISRMTIPSVTTEKNAGAGTWRKPWNDPLQSKWLEAMVNIILSKPFVEAISWGDIVDSDSASTPGSGLLTTELAAKPAMQTWLAMRRAVMSVRQSGSKTPGAGAVAAGSTGSVG